MQFWKFQGAGNDFVMVDQRQQQWLTRADQARIERLCDRRFGIGADGLILLQNSAEYDFEMVYFNADGRESTLCGNGGRCIVAFAHQLGLIGESCRFLAIDGPHEANIQQRATGKYWVELHMNDVQNIDFQEDNYVLNTGSPHYVRFVPNVEQADMVSEGKSVRYSDRFKAQGINVNLATLNSSGNGLRIRTYERGVEDETLACGTGVTAAALAAAVQQKWEGEMEVPVQALGGNLAVRFKREGNGEFSNIWLCGPAEAVFEGRID
ncbi:MAG: diaminopimelate epimerase [Saprospiraceae bacterium]|nr:diaminopimelate epimerase [Saprospiraceae bacterium]